MPRQKQALTILVICLLMVLITVAVMFYLWGKDRNRPHAPLTISTVPDSAKVEFLEPHTSGETLPPGQYMIRVSHPDFHSLDSLIHHGHEPTQVRIHLDSLRIPEENKKQPSISDSNTLPSDQPSFIALCTDINTATTIQLKQVQGIGTVKAESVINYRDKNGPFKSMDELHQITGIGETAIKNFGESGFCVHDAIPINYVREDPFVRNPPPENLNYAELCAEVLEKNAKQQFSPLTPSSDSVFDRSLYHIWGDADRDCQNTRHEVLIAQSRIDVDFDETGCKVIKGEWTDPYTDTLITNPGYLDIDHFIPLAEAHRSGGDVWAPVRRYCFANDLSENGMLIPVLSSANRSKGDRDPAHWLPENKSYHCQYVERWVALKKAWGLTIDSDEQKSIEAVETRCTAKEP